jgi:2-polyprenyl-6-methoxyphenol hydroxylase-like FAD-dependent oxidoreductase
MIDVLIVGAGPTGLTLAAELARHGASYRIVDLLERPNDKSKALGVHARTLEAMDDMGLVDRALAIGRVLHGASVYSESKRIAHVDFDEVDSPYPFVLCLPQAETERLFEALVVERGGCVERSATVTALAQDADGVTATIEKVGGTIESEHARWVVGCDGSHSAVRHALGIPFEGAKYEEAFALADVTLVGDLADDEMHAYLSPEGLVAALPLPGAGRFRLMVDRPRDQAGAPATLEEFQHAFSTRARADIEVRDATWMAPFQIHRRIVSRYRVGRVFLAGDAAHIHSPVAGQGMNTGIQDAYNLAWKLALVAKGASLPELLDSYEEERRPIAAATVEGTDFATRVVTLRNPIARNLRDTLAGFLTSLEVVQARITRTVAEIGLSYRKSRIVEEHRAAMFNAIADRSTEVPSLSEWLDFGSAPHAGDRAPDAALGLPPYGPRAFDFLRETKHVLFLFDGAAETAEGYANMGALAAKVRAKYDAHVAVRFVVPRAELPAAIATEKGVVLDPEGAFHRRYGAGAECLYLVRPDGYIAYRSQPADGEKLFAYLGRIFA